MYGYVFLLPEESGCGQIQLGEFLEEEGAGHGPCEVSCWPLLQGCWSGQFSKQTDEKVFGKLSVEVN